MDIIFDTNTYRGFTYSLKDLSRANQLSEINRLKNCITNNNFNVKINFWVLCEIMQHLCDENDPAYRNCSETLKTMITLSEQNGHVFFNPTFEYILTRKFNHPNEEYFKTIETNIAKIAVEFVENGKTDIFNKYVCEIPKYIDNYKEQVYEGLISAKAELKKAGIKNIPIDDDSLHYLVLAGRISGLIGIDPKSISDEILDEFHQSHYFGLARSVKVLSKGYHSDDLGDKFLNNFIDQSICDEFGLTNNSIFISNDGQNKEGVRTTFIEKNHPNKVILLEEFLKQIQYNV